MISLHDLQSQLRFIDSIHEDDEQGYEKILKAFINIKDIPAFTNIFYRIGNDNKPNVTFRTRTHTDSDFFDKIGDISTPPNWIVKSYGRCNRPNQSVFYSSENRPTSYMELVEYWAREKNIGEKISVTIGVWEFQRDLKFYIIPKPNLKERRTYEEKHYGSIYDQKMAENGFVGHPKQVSDMVFEFMYNKFSKSAKNDKRTYMITSAFSNLMLASLDIDGIIYPSVPFGGNGYNSAIKKSVVESGALKLVDVTKDSFIIGETEEGKHHFVQYDTFSTKDINHKTGEIKWNHGLHFLDRLMQLKNPFV